MHQVVILLAKHIDTMAAAKVEGYTKDLLYNAMKETEKAKGRLLYYYPLDEKKGDDTSASKKEDTWIGWKVRVSIVLLCELVCLICMKYLRSE